MTRQAELLQSGTRLGGIAMANRVVMAPMTRSRSTETGFLPDAATRYYHQRASAGLIVSEGVTIAPSAIGNPALPGIWHDEHVEMWRAVTRAVHSAGGSIVMQLWHTGRSSHPLVQPGGIQPVGPSPIAIQGQVFVKGGLVPFVAPRELSTAEIPGLVHDYAQAAERAMIAGFDGVEVHAANGYLPDQFLHDSSNQRTDMYGGSVTNRARFLLEVVDAVTEAVGAELTGVRISPSSTFKDMFDSDKAGLFSHVLESLDPLGLAYLHVVEPGIDGTASAAVTHDALDSRWIRQRWRGGLISAGNHTRSTALALLSSATADAIAFGRPFISNPDLVRRLVDDLPVVAPDRETFYGGTEIGYTDYPAWDELAADAPAGSGDPDRDPAGSELRPSPPI